MDIQQIQELRSEFLETTNILISYERRHVKMYHEWMQDTKLRELTGSSVSSRYQDYEQQRIWQNSTINHIFLIVDPKTKQPVGDVNLFLLSRNPDDPKVGELMVMIAEKKSRKKGLAFKAVKLMMKFGREYLGVVKFKAHIKGDNSASLKLFESRLGFIRTECVFGEWTLESNDAWEIFEPYEGPPQIDLTGFLKWGEKKKEANVKSNPNPRR